MIESHGVSSAGKQAAKVAEKPPSRPPWLWPLRPFTIVMVGSVLACAFFANFPAVEAPHPELRDATFGQHFNLLTEYEHGWPLAYARRETVHRTSAEGPHSAWRPWEGLGRWSTVNLLIDLGLWSLLIIAAGIAAQWWRAERRAVWQLGLRDLLVLTGVAGVAFAWLADQRAEYWREKALVETLRTRPGQAVLAHQFGARVPVWWPPSLQAPYRQLFDRPCYFHSSGDTDLACQHRHVIVLHELTFHPDFRSHLARMPRLEAIDLCFVKLPYFDATRQATILRDLAPLPNLRGINLEKTNVTDADLAWLSSCRQLEVINLSQTSIGDRGLAQLASLPRLRWLRISSDRITDRGCQAIAQMQALEELSLASRNVHDAGALELTKLRKLRRLEVTAATTEAAHDSLRRELPGCKLKGSHYRN